VRAARRALLAGLAGGLAAGLSAALTPGLAWGDSRGAGEGRRSDPIRQRWPTGNSRLAPPGLAGDGLAGDQVLYAGDRTIGAISIRGERLPWQAPHGLASAAVFRPRTAGAHLVCGGLHDIGCWGLDDHAPHCAPVWRYRARTQLGVPLVSAERTYLGDGHEVVALETRSGETLWRFAATPDTQISFSPAMSGDVLFVGPGDGSLYALGAADGALRWSLDGRAQWKYLRQLQVSGEVLVAGGYLERLYGLSTLDGSVLWSFNAGNFINSYCVAAGTAYLWSPTGWLCAVDAQGGEVRWRHRTSDYGEAAANWAAVLAELAVQGGRLYALAMDHVLHVLNAENGAALGRLALPEPVRPAVLPVPGVGAVLAAAQGDLILLDDVA